MGYKILIDSCGEIPQSLMSTGVVENIPLSIMVEDETIIDDEKGELLSPRVTAAILGYSEASLRTMRCQYPDKIKFVKRGNRVFYYKSSIDEFIKLIPPKKK